MPISIESDVGSVLSADPTIDMFFPGQKYSINGSDDLAFTSHNSFTSGPQDVLTNVVTETANDGSATNTYLSIASDTVSDGPSGTNNLMVDISRVFFTAHVGTEIKFHIEMDAFARVPGGGIAPDGTASIDLYVLLLPLPPSAVQQFYYDVTRTGLPLDQARAEASMLDAGTTTFDQLFKTLLPQVADTTTPAVAVEGSMYGTVGTSDEITNLVTKFLPAQVENAIQNGLNPQVYACEVLGLAFAFGDENGATTFATNFGPTVPAMPATPAGDAAFAAAAAGIIFASAVNAGTSGAIRGFVSNWEDFYSAHGIPGIPQASADQIDLAARGAAWGDAVGVALANNLGPLPGQVINFLADAAQGYQAMGVANYGGLLASQPPAHAFEGGTAAPSAALGASQVQLTGVAAPFDHILM